MGHSHKSQRDRKKVAMHLQHSTGKVVKPEPKAAKKSRVAAASTTEVLAKIDAAKHLRPAIIAALVLVPLLLWAYWPTFVWMETQWRIEPDYSHGYLILPLACLILYSRRDLFPGIREKLSWGGLSLIIVAGVMRVLGRIGYMDFVDGWSLVPWVGGLIWFVMGWRAFVWSIPAVVFLFLLVPLPFQLESLLSWKLQGVATDGSVVFLRILGQPAVSEGHTIWIGETQLLVEEACSGLRIFVGMGALAIFWAAMVRRSWIDRLVILASALPLAILANVIRITLTGFLFQWLDESWAHKVHDFAGYMMIPLAAFMLWCVKVLWENLYRPIEVTSQTQLLRTSIDGTPPKGAVPT